MSHLFFKCPLIIFIIYHNYSVTICVFYVLNDLVSLFSWTIWKRVCVCVCVYIYIYIYNTHIHVHMYIFTYIRGFPGASVVKNLPAIPETCRRRRFDAWVAKIPWRRKWQPTPVFLSRESHGQRSLGDYGPWGLRVRHNWATEHTYTYIYIHITFYIILVLNTHLSLKSKEEGCCLTL